VPVPLAYGPGVDPELTITLDGGSIWRQVLDTHEPVLSMGPLGSDPSMSGVLLPIRIRDSVVGLVALERRGRPWRPDEVQAAQALIDRDAARIDAALLFDEVRHLATAEERQRLAREIHDGVAQEVASLGYLIDDLVARSPEGLQADLRSLRDELSRVVSELRYSIFDLRREIGPGATLTSVLADHARHVGETSGIAVHLDLSESPSRLRPAVEAELLRIAQEAIANARKHSRAQNLWVTCRVDAPQVRLQVEDDGRGLLPPREDSFGLAIMRERATRAGCALEVRGRPGGGTTVEVHTVLDQEAPDIDGGREPRSDDSRAAGR
jgi:signal transduction histidine kinase